MNLLGVSVRQGFLGSGTLRGTGCAIAFGAGLSTDGRISGFFSRCRAFLAGVFPAHPRVENHDQRSASEPFIKDAALSVSLVLGHIEPEHSRVWRQREHVALVQTVRPCRKLTRFIDRHLRPPRADPQSVVGMRCQFGLGRVPCFADPVAVA
jgi:hypothetical protein